MKCLFCNKETGNTSDIDACWHKKCIKTFFGTDRIPTIDISDEMLRRLADESTNKGYTVPGVQKKLSLHLSDDDGKPRLTLVNYPTGYILKPQAEQYERLPESEFLVMQMAKETGIKIVPCALLKIKDSYVYITKRIDRPQKGGVTKILAMEDFCQLDGRLTEDKYKGSYERCGKIVAEYSCRTAFDLSELFLRIVFCFVVGNSDMHLKNFSLIETEEGSGRYVLSEAYDLLPVNIILPNDKSQFGLAMNGKKSNVRRKDFLKFAANIGLGETVANRLIDTVCRLENKYIAMCDDSYMSDGQKQRLKELISDRVGALCANKG